MTRDDIIKLAREAGLTVGTNISGVMLVGSPAFPSIAHITIEEMIRFAALVAAAEREACARVCEEMRHPSGYSAETEDWVGATDNCAAAIRARGEKK